MSSRLRAAVLIAVVAGLFAVAEVVWVLAYLDRSSDGPAFVMALVVTVVLPTLVAAIAASLVPSAPRRARVAAIGAVAASGFAAAGVEAGIFIADDPADPAFIHWVAALPLFALVVAALLAGAAAWSPLAPLPRTSRIVLTAVAAVLGPVLFGVVIVTGMPLVILVALASPVVLVAVVAVRRQRGQAAV